MLSFNACKIKFTLLKCWCQNVPIPRTNFTLIMQHVNLTIRATTFCQFRLQRHRADDTYLRQWRRRGRKSHTGDRREFYSCCSNFSWVKFFNLRVANVSFPVFLSLSRLLTVVEGCMVGNHESNKQQHKVNSDLCLENLWFGCFGGRDCK